jgi:hypothetical protein
VSTWLHSIQTIKVMYRDSVVMSQFGTKVRMHLEEGYTSSYQRSFATAFLEVYALFTIDFH